MTNHTITRHIANNLEVKWVDPNNTTRFAPIWVEDPTGDHGDRGWEICLYKDSEGLVDYTVHYTWAPDRRLADEGEARSIDGAIFKIATYLNTYLDNNKDGEV